MILHFFFFFFFFFSVLGLIEIPVERLKIEWVCGLIRTLGKTRAGRDGGQGNENAGAKRKESGMKRGRKGVMDRDERPRRRDS